MTIHSVVIQKLLSTNAHLGRRVATNHFKIYSCGSRNAMTIIDSDKTLICLRNACDFISNLVRSRARFLFVNTNNLFDEIISEMTKAIGVKPDNSWRLGGFLTNSSSPKKFRGRNKKLNLGAIQAPDCVIIFDTERKSSVINEASKLNIPIVGLVDSSMPWDTFKRITYPVPANPSVQFVYLFCNMITKTFLYEQKRLRAASGTAEKTREDVQQIGERETATKGKIFVLPYERLAPTSDDVSKIKQLLDKLLVLKYNGNLETKMGLDGPKSAIEVCEGLTCLDMFINQLESVNSKYGCNLPLLLVNTLHTHDATMKILGKHPNKNVHAFIQSPHEEESISDLQLESSTVDNSQDEIFTEILHSLKKSGQLDVLLSQGKEYIILLNSDNLANIVDEKILYHLIQNKVDHCMEVMPASSDLEETEPPSHEGIYQSREKLKFTDTMWVSLSTVKSLVGRSFLKESLPILELFDRPYAINVPKSRYVPVEATSDLLILQSDLYTLGDGILMRNTARENPINPDIDLGPEFENINDFHSRFKSIPSIVHLESLKVSGDVWFGSGITLKGKVKIAARLGMKIVVPDGAILENKIITSQGDLGGLS